MQVDAQVVRWADQSDQWPPRVKDVVAAVEAGRSPAADRRRWDRLRYRVKAQLHLKDAAGPMPSILFTRDANPHSIGFVTWHKLPVGKEGTIHLPLDDGEPREVACCVMRCRDFTDGWYEGALFFLEEQPTFSAINMDEG